MTAVIAAAVLFLIFNPEPGKGASVSANSDKPKSMAENVSRFYSEFRASSRDPIEEKYGEFVVLLEKEDRSIEELVADVDSVSFAEMSNWQGEFKQRAFSKGSTIMAEAEKHVGNGGLTLVWALNQDFVIRHRFVSENTLAGMLSEVASAIDANFIHTVQVFYCEKKRAMIITDTTDEYLEKSCKMFIDNGY